VGGTPTERELAAAASAATWSKVTNGDHSTTELPRSSMPRRPARPVSWVNCAGVRNSWPSPVYLVSFSITTGAGRHVDAERQRLGGEHHLDQALDEAGLHRLP
jgi:hypothetical protein